MEFSAFWKPSMISGNGILSSALDTQTIDNSTAETTPKNRIFMIHSRSRNRGSHRHNWSRLQHSFLYIEYKKCSPPQIPGNPKNSEQLP